MFLKLFISNRKIQTILVLLTLILLLLPSFITNVPKLFPSHLVSGTDSGIRRMGGWFGYASGEQTDFNSREAELYASYVQLQDEYLRLKEKFLSVAQLRESRLTELPAVLAVDVIVPWDSSPWRRSFVINSGYEDGIEENLPVAYGRNIVGRISEVGQFVSRVQLVTDPGFHMEVTIMPDYNLDTAGTDKRFSGILNGTGEDDCIVEHIMWDVPIKEGWVVLSEGDEKGYWRKGFVLGRVTKVSASRGAYLKITVEPEINLTLVKNALVLKFPRGVR